MTASTEKLLLTPAEAARRLGIGRSKLYELLQRGELPSVRIGKCRRVSSEALASFVARLEARENSGYPQASTSTAH